MAAAPEKARCRWFHVTPGRLLVVLLAVEGLRWLSERFGWFAWHKGYAVLVAVAVVGVFFMVMLGWLLLALLFRLRFQYSLLSLLVLAVAVALPFAWLATEMKAAKKQREAIQVIENEGGSVVYDYPGGFRGAGGVPPQPAWLRKLLGDDVVVSVTSAGLGPFRTTDFEIEQLKPLTELQSLDAFETRVTDAGLPYLERLTKLQELNLGGTKVTDAGLQHLKGLTKLNFLNLWHTNVTDYGVEKLQQALPNCEIYR